MNYKDLTLGYRRASVIVVDDVVGIGDAGDRKEAERLAALSACYEILLKGYVRSHHLFCL